MSNLPVELLHSIAAAVETTPALLQLRLVSKTLNVVATPLAFRVITVNDSVKSADALSFLQGSDGSVASAVREVRFEGDLEEEQWTGENETSGEAGRQALRAAFSRLAKFANLERLRFDFHGFFQEDTQEISNTPTHFLRLQLDIFAALAAGLPPPRLVSLTLNNVLAVPAAIYAQPAFHAFLSRLYTFELSVLCEAEPEGAYLEMPLGEFFASSVAHMLRSVTAVRYLALRSSSERGHPVGHCPVIPFGDTRLPHLAALTLEGFALQPATREYDAAAFVVAHAATLAHLELCGCTIDGGGAVHFPRPWGAVLALFEAELVGLRTFAFTADPGGVDSGLRDPRFAYTWLEVDWGYLPMEEAVEGEEGDLPALESLMAAVKARALSDAGEDVE
ncbi:hypothetical protein B0H15DRAFT_156497 [Mycena belliarum]|uniref:F-box domain-containing protein n=1 Tax=Mycena belliarum TaxID=1033014 RepID=A0AAD6UC17_9AGAR|nr:hypothetical protein B0H15DRAFT_156497 [Mycena belliae]